MKRLFGGFMGVGIILFVGTAGVVAVRADGGTSTTTKASARPAELVSIGVKDADSESALVASEDTRLQDVRTISTLARWQNRAQKTPYRLSTAGGYTLVLTPRSSAYGFNDLLQLEPQTLVKLSDGSYLLSEDIVLLAGAELKLSHPGGLTLRMASSPDGFSSIVSDGGRLSIVGTAAAPFRITSWDARAGRPDTTTSDGRAYLRAIGGQIQVSYARLTDLGFWSGRTGGLAMTGTNRPNIGALNSSTLSSSGVPELPGSVGDTKVIPAGKLPNGAAVSGSTDTSGLSYVSGRIDNTIVTGDAFGLFVSGAEGIDVDQSSFLNSQIAGIDFHRFVRSSIIQRTRSDHSGGDGVSLGRGTQGVQISQSYADNNAHDGFVIAGNALADGPSAVGSPIETYGNDSISNSTANGNSHYGIHIKDGFNMSVDENHVFGGVMGIVVSDAASNVSVTANQVSGVHTHGIALLDGVLSGRVTGNTVADGQIYLRDSRAIVQGNTVSDVNGHGVSVVGAASGTVIAYNVITGSGTSAIDTARARGSVTRNGNATTGWRDTTAIVTHIEHTVLQPMTLLWAALIFLVVLSMIKGIGRPTFIRGTHPYAHQTAHLRRSQA